MDNTEIEHFQELREAYLKRLRVLELRKARQGFNTPPEIVIEIQDLCDDLAETEASLREAYLRRLRVLEDQKAQEGINTPLEIVIETQDLRKNVEEIETSLRRTNLKKAVIETSLRRANLKDIVFIAACISVVVLAFFFLFNTPYLTRGEAGNTVQPPTAPKNDNYTIPKDGITDFENRPNIGYTQPLLKDSTVKFTYPLAFAPHPSIYQQARGPEEPLDDDGISIVLQKVQYYPLPTLVWDIQNNTNESISISPNYIKFVDVFDEDGRKYFSNSSSCDATSICLGSGFDLRPQAAIEITNTVEITQTATLCQNFFVLKSGVKSSLTRVWLIQLNCKN